MAGCLDSQCPTTVIWRDLTERVGVDGVQQKEASIQDKDTTTAWLVGR
jgi:hypothetical protein